MKPGEAQATTPGNEPGKRPNVVLITIDSLRADRLGCYGGPGTLAPNLDRLATDGVRFHQAITGGSWTQAAFPAILTSTYASMFGGCLGPLSDQRPSGPEALAAQGYSTVAFSTSPLLNRRFGYQRGFDEFHEVEPREADPALRRVRGGQVLLRTTLTHRIARWMGQTLRPARVYASAETVNEEIFRWLERARPPFFVWVHYMDAHWPYHLEETLQSPEGIAQAWKDLSDMYRLNWQGGRLSPRQHARFRDLYEDAVRHIDRNVGVLVQRLEASPHGEDTVLAVVADHGEEFLERRHWGHVEINLHDEIVRVPMIIRSPAGPQGRVVPQQVRTLDLMPTILEMCGCNVPTGMLGTSLSDLWAGDLDDGHRVALCERWRDDSRIIAVRTGSYKYIWDDSRPDAPELYDLRSDPQETHNVRNEFPEVVQDLHRHVEQQLARANATRPENMPAAEAMDEALLMRLRNLGYVE
jgi:arylsulfatase A-like enzyme